jgi:putative heme-binding domain-containing protein
LTSQTLLDAIARSRLRELPAAWVEPVRRSLGSTNAAIAREAVNVAGKFPAETFLASLVELGFKEDEPEELRTAALATIGRQGKALDPKVFDYLVARCQETVGPTERMAAADALGSAALTDAQLIELATVARQASPIELPLLFSAIARRQPLPPEIAAPWLAALAVATGTESLPPGQIESTFASLPPLLASQAKDLMSKLGAGSAEQAQRLLELSKTLVGGDPERGKAVFFGKKAACFACHRIGDQGGIVGPDLSAIGKIRNRKDLTEAITFPSASLARGYQSYAVALTNGEVVTGVLAKEAGDAIYLRNTQREELRIDRQDIDSLQPTTLSIMPQGLDKTMTVEEFSDLLAYLESLR